jgi:hypothetical protein
MLRRSNRLALPLLRNTCLIFQEAIAHLRTMEQTKDELPFTLSNLHKYRPPPQDLEHYAMPMIHPVTSESISSYKRLMNNPVTADTLMRAFGKDFGRMSQGDNKTGQPGTNAMFVMLSSDVPNIPKDRVITYAKVVVNHHLQKVDPNQIRITSGGNLINYPGELITRTADITTAKLLWNSMLSTPGLSICALTSKTSTFPPR